MNRLSLSPAEERLEQAFFELEAGIDIAEIILHDLFEVSNDMFGQIFLTGQHLQNGQLSLDPPEDSFTA